MVEMVPLVTLADRFEARVMAARFGADGILCRLQGEIDTPYPLGPVVVLVEAAHLDEARALLLLDEAAAVLDGVDRAAAPAPVTWMLLAVPVLVGIVLVTRMMWFLV